MRRIFITVIALALALVLFTVPAFAEEAADTTTSETTETTETVTETPSTPENTAPTEEERFYDQIVEFVSNGANWAKIGGVVLAIIAAIGAVTANLNKVKAMIDGVTALLKGKATKEETEKIVGDNLAALKDTYDKQYSELKKQYDEQAERNTELTAVMTVLALQLVKSPYARTEIMGLLSGAKAVNGNVKDIVEAVEEEIAKAEAEEEKEPTPALDAIKASVNTTETAAVSGGINMGW
jgi:hypothetical protein